jgi:hypothetical protein
VNVPLADPVPKVSVHDFGVPKTTCVTPELVIVQGPAASLGKPVTDTVITLCWKAIKGEIVIDG